MPSSYSDNLKLELMETGANASTWGDNTNNNLNIVDAYTSGVLQFSVANTSPNIEATNKSSTSNAAHKVIEFTGTLTGNTIATIPAVEGNYLIYNNTTANGHTFSVSAYGHTANAIELANGSYSWVYNTSSNVVRNGLTTFGSITSNGNITATSFIGDGSSLTNIEPFASGTKMLFQQTSAPTGWTKDSTHDNKALRVVTGAASSGGSNSFSGVFNSNVAVSGTSNNSTVTISGSTAGHVLTQAQLPDYTLIPDQRAKTEDKGPLNRGSSSGSGASYQFLDIPSGGSDEAHSHGAGTLAGDAHSHTYTSNLNLDVQYVDLIIATKD